MADGSDLTRWNLARGLAGDILAAVVDEDRRGRGESQHEGGEYDYRGLVDDHPERNLPSEEALRTSVSLVLCAVDERHLDFSMSDGNDPTTRSQPSHLADEDDHDAGAIHENGGNTASLWTRCVNLLARWLMSDRSDVHIAGVTRHRLNSWNEARHLAAKFVKLDSGGVDYEHTTEEWPHVTFPDEETVHAVVTDALTSTDTTQGCIDEVARWVKSLDWLERDGRDRHRVAMGEGDGTGDTTSAVLKQTDQLTLTGDVQHHEPRTLGQYPASATGAGVDGDEHETAPASEDDLDGESAAAEDAARDGAGDDEAVEERETETETDPSGMNQTLSGCFDTVKSGAEPQ